MTAPRARQLSKQLSFNRFQLDAVLMAAEAEEKFSKTLLLSDVDFSGKKIEHLKTLCANTDASCIDLKKIHSGRKYSEAA